MGKVDLLENLKELDIYEIAELVIEYYMCKYNEEYISLEDLEKNRDKYMFYLSAKELSQW